MLSKLKSKLLLATTVTILVSPIIHAKDITVWSWDKNFNVAAMEKAAEIYKVDHPNVSFNLVNMARPDIEQKLHTMLSAGITSALPDIVLIEDYSSQKYLQGYPGSFAEIKSSDFIPYKVAISSFDGKTYSVPFDTGVTGMFVRTDILKKAGYSMEDLSDITWERYIEVGKDVLQKTGIQLLAVDPNYLAILRMMIQTNHAWYTDKNGNVTLAGNKSLIKSMNLLKELYKSDLIRSTGGWNNWVQASITGKVATVPTAVWFTHTIESREENTGKWGLVSTPRLNIKGAVNAGNNGGGGWYVLNSSENKNKAIDFLKETFGKNKDFYQRILLENGVVGSYTPALSGSAYTQRIKYFNNQKIYADFASWMPNIAEINYGSYTIEAEEAIISVMPMFLKDKLTAEQALIKAEKRLLRQIR
jgi:lactose/L-arabinose transport system substrate-binding protein